MAARRESRRVGMERALGEDLLLLLGAELGPLARRQRAESEVAYLCADEAQSRVADGCGHAPDLAVFALGESELEPRE